MIIVYSYYVLDILHQGHLLFMKNAKALSGKNGKLIVGILTDDAVMEKKRRPILAFEERMEIAKSIKYADAVVAQNTYSPLPNVERIKPDILVESESHNDDDIERACNLMKTINGKVVVLPYYSQQSSTEIKNRIKEIS